MAKPKHPEKNFETSLSTLEQIVAQLESGDLPLERSLELFEDGVGLVRHCQSQLQDAERKVEMLLRERGEIKVVAFGAGDAEHTKPQNEVDPPAQPSGSRANSRNNSGEDEEDFDDSIPF